MHQSRRQSRHQSLRRQQRAAFTLVELMVVILILGLLAGVMAVAVTDVFGSNHEKVTQTNIISLKTGLESFKRVHHVYPPNHLDELHEIFDPRASTLTPDPNAINNGVETMVYALRSRVGSSGQNIDASLLNEHGVNLDSDSTETNFGNAESPDLLEFADGWGNPLVYLNLRSLESVQDFDVQKADGSLVTISIEDLREKIRNEHGIQVPRGFMIWSFGEDGINEYGRGDDVCSWSKIVIGDEGADSGN